MSFKEFLEMSEKQKNETMTSTANVAQFHRIAIPLITRMFPPEDAFFKKLRKQTMNFKLVK